MSRWNYITWTGRMDTLGSLWPSVSLAHSESLAGAIEAAQREQKRAAMIGRPIGACVITTWGDQKNVACVPAAVDSFQLEAQPATIRPKAQFANDPAKQRKLLDGLDCCAGQNDLFDEEGGAR